MITVFECGGPNSFVGAKTKSLIQLDQSTRKSSGLRFTVTYGLQQDKRLTYAKACTALGRAIVHNACCEGLADNTGD